MGVSKGRVYNYEGLFLVSQAVAHNLGEAVEEIESVLARGEANVIAFSKWDERRLAYEINKSKRGVYFLVYFSCDPVHMDTIERACNLSEKLMRVMFTRADHLTEDEMKATDGRARLQDEVKVRSAEIASEVASTAPAAATITSASELAAEKAAADAAAAAQKSEASAGDSAPAEGDEAPAEASSDAAETPAAS